MDGDAVHDEQQRPEEEKSGAVGPRDDNMLDYMFIALG